MIQAIGRHNGRSSALCICDSCGREQEVVCDYMHLPNNKWIPNEGQVLRKITADRWTHLKNRLRCPACEAKRIVKKDVETVEKVTDLRAPTREQKRQIVDLLTAVYDVAAERYRHGETDLTVAEAIGGGCMFGWVSAIREEMFGPAGSNEEMEALRAEMADLRNRIDMRILESDRMIEAERKSLAEIEKKFAAVLKALGPRGKAA